MSNNWHIGMKVVCVQASACPRQQLVIGNVYTIRALIIACCRGGVMLDVGLSLKSKCKHCQYMDGTAWKREKCFRSLDELSDQLERIEREGAPAELELQTLPA